MWLHLHPWPGEPAPDGVAVKARVCPDDHGLRLSWMVEDRLGVIDWPVVSEEPGRRDGLWEGTCLEAFRGGADAASYEELNVSPAGHWQIYDFFEYRAGCRVDPAVAKPDIRVRTGDGVHVVDVCWAMPRRPSVLRLGLTAMVRTHAGAMSCWALRHPGTQPDFHLAEARMIELVSLPSS